MCIFLDPRPRGRGKFCQQGAWTSQPPRCPSLRGEALELNGASRGRPTWGRSRPDRSWHVSRDEHVRDLIVRDLIVLALWRITPAKHPNSDMILGRIGCRMVGPGADRMVRTYAPATLSGLAVAPLLLSCFCSAVLALLLMPSLALPS